MAPGIHSAWPTSCLTSGPNKPGPMTAVKKSMAPNHTAALSNPINLSIGATGPNCREIEAYDKQRPTGGTDYLSLKSVE